MDTIVNRLFSLQDTVYKEFQCRLMPTVDPDTVIGVRTPALRKLAKNLAGTDEAAAFLNTLPHTYYEENNLHAFLLEEISDFTACIAQLDRFLPHVNNWATCDCMSPPVLKKDLSSLEEKIDLWLSSNHVYTVRYGMGMLMRYYLDERFTIAYPEKVAAVSLDDYYIRMMQAWYFATALAKQYEAALSYLERERLPVWVHNKTIQKACESYRIPDTHKTYLRTLRRR